MTAFGQAAGSTNETRRGLTVPCSLEGSNMSSMRGGAHGARAFKSLSATGGAERCDPLWVGPLKGRPVRHASQYLPSMRLPCQGVL